MTDREILSSAIDKAISNGWNDNEAVLSKEIIPILFQDNLADDLLLRGIIFSQQFAKAFWGYKQTPWHYTISRMRLEPVLDTEDTIPAWQYHLQKLVLEKDRIKYLEQFLNKD